jgi:hypothetical protein
MTHTQLSKWWKTKSCRDAINRARLKKKESLNKFLRDLKSKKDKLKKDAEEWEVVE